MDLKNLSDDELLKNTEQAASDERVATGRLLRHLCEVQRRRLFARQNCASLFEYCVKILRMSEPQASRRVNAARLLKEFPHIEQKLTSGALTLTAANQVQSFFKKETRLIPHQEKLEILKQIENRSTRDTEKVLLSRSTLPQPPVRELAKVVSATVTEIRFGADDKTMENLKRLKEIWSHQMPNASYADLIKKMAEYCVSQLDPVKRAERNQVRRAKAIQAGMQPPKPEVPPKYPTAVVEVPKPSQCLAPTPATGALSSGTPAPPAYALLTCYD